MTINNLCPIIKLYLVLSHLELFSEVFSFQSQLLAKPQISQLTQLQTRRAVAAVGVLCQMPQSSPAGLDKFGIKEIYPTMQGGREWYINMSNPRNDNIFSIGTGFPMRT